MVTEQLAGPCWEVALREVPRSLPPLGGKALWMQTQPLFRNRALKGWEGNGWGVGWKEGWGEEGRGGKDPESQSGGSWVFSLNGRLQSPGYT